MKRRRILLATVVPPLVVAVAAVGLLKAPDPPPLSDRLNFVVGRKHLGSEVLAVLLRSDGLQVARFRSGSRGPGAESYLDYDIATVGGAVIQRGPALGQRTARRFADILMDPQTWSGPTFGSSPSYRREALFAFHLTAGEDRVLVIWHPGMDLLEAGASRGGSGIYCCTINRYSSSVPGARETLTDFFIECMLWPHADPRPMPGNEGFLHKFFRLESRP